MEGPYSLWDPVEPIWIPSNAYVHAGRETLPVLGALDFCLQGPMRTERRMQGPGGVAPQHPVDRGWAWMICLGAFGLNFFVNGGLRSMGLLFIQIVMKYDADASIASLTVSVLAGGFAIFSAVGNAVGAIKTMRAACLFGGFMMFLGMLLTTFAPNIYFVIVSLGLLSGIGYGFSFGPSMVMVGQYFNKRRSLANGLASAGGSIGTMLLPLFIRSSTDYYGFSGTLLIYSAIILHAIPAAMLLRPVSFYNRRPRLQPSIQTDVSEVKVVRREQISEKAKRANRYELVGSKVIAVPIDRSLEHLALDEPIKEEPAPPVTAAAPPPPPPGPPPKVTCGLVVRMFFQKLCDKDILHMWAYLAYVAGLSIGHGGYINNCTFLPAYVNEVFQSQTTASLMVGILGAADLVGRVSGGWFADLNLVRKPFIIGFSFVVAGAATVVYPFFPTYPATIIYIVVFGLLGGAYMAQMVVIVAELVGPAKTPSGLGLSTMIMGLTIIPLIPLLGKTAKATQTFASAVRLAGILLFIGGVLFYMIPFLQNLQAKKKAAAAKKQLEGSEALNGETKM